MRQVCFKYKMHNLCFNLLTILGCLSLFFVAVAFLIFPFELINAVHQTYDPYQFMTCSGSSLLCLPFDGLVNFRLMTLLVCAAIIYTLFRRVKSMDHYRHREKPGLIISDDGICVNASCESAKTYPREVIRSCKVYGFEDHIGLNINLKEADQVKTINCDLDHYDVSRHALKSALSQHGYLPRV